MHIIFPKELLSLPIRTVVNRAQSCHHCNLHLFFFFFFKEKVWNWSTVSLTHTHICCKTIYKQLCLCAQRRAQRDKRGRTVTDSHRKNTGVFVLSLIQDLCVLCLWRGRREHTPDLACVLLSVPLHSRHKCINIRPLSLSLTVVEGRAHTHTHDTNASIRHEDKWGTASAPHHKKKNKNTSSYSCFGPLRSAVQWSKWLFSWLEADKSSVPVCSVPVSRPGMDGSFLGLSPSHLLPVRVEEPGALHRPSCDQRAHHASLPASVYPQLKAWHMAWRSANSANVGSLSVCVCVNSAGKGLLLSCLMDRLWFSLLC